MSHRWFAPAHRRRSRLLSALALAAAGATALATAGLGSAPAGAAPPAKATITITSALTQTDTPPVMPGRGSSYVVQGQPFTVGFTVSAPLSTSKSTRLVLTVTSGPDAGSMSVGYDLPANATSGSIPDAQLGHAANDVQLKVDVDPSKNTVRPGTASVDVLKTSLSAPGNSSLTGFGGGGGVGVPCSPTPADQVCGDLLVPSTRTALSRQFLSQGCVAACDNAASYLQALVDLAAMSQPDEEQNPIVVVAKCDKTLCAGKGIKSYSVKVALNAGDTPVKSPACSAKGVIDSGETFCTDYRQSTRDIAGDVLLYVLLARDAKIIFG
jgi:hypothetical protein